MRRSAAESENDEISEDSSISILRINSEEESIRSRLSSEIVYEPGLKLLDGLRGDWRDMERFI
jgi:hypothetical protein